MFCLSATHGAPLITRPSFMWKAVAVTSLLPALQYAGMYPPWYLCLTMMAFAGATCCEESSTLVRNRLDLLSAYKEKVAFGYMLVAITWAFALSLMQWSMMSVSCARTRHLASDYSLSSTVTMGVFWGLFAFSWGWTTTHDWRGRKALWLSRSATIIGRQE
jgi:hypothetical protein